MDRMLDLKSPKPFAQGDESDATTIAFQSASCEKLRKVCSVSAYRFEKPAGSIASPDHRHGSRETAAHIEREKSFRALDLLRASLFRELLICFKNLANAGRSDRVTIGNQAPARVHWNLKRRFEFFRAHVRQCCRSAFHKLDAFARLGESENFVGHNFSNGKAIVHLGALQIARRQIRHPKSFLGRFPCG